MWPKIILNIGSNVAIVVKNIHIKIKKIKIKLIETEADAEDKEAIKISSSGINPLVPGNPAFAREVKKKKNENNGIVDNKPENEVIERVWYLSDNMPTKKNIAEDVNPWLIIKYIDPFIPISVNVKIPKIEKLIWAIEEKAT